MIFSEFQLVKYVFSFGYQSVFKPTNFGRVQELYQTARVCAISNSSLNPLNRHLEIGRVLTDLANPSLLFLYELSKVLFLLGSFHLLLLES